MDKKREPAVTNLLKNDLSQVLRYVDFIAANYAGGNYDAVTANYLVHQVRPEVKKVFLEAVVGNGEVSDVISRSFILDPWESPATHVWRDLNLLEYRWNNNSGILEVQAIT